MNYPPRILRSILFLLLPSLILLVFVEFAIHISSQPKSVAAHTGEVFGPACGKPTIDGEVNSGEWSTASQKTFFMQGANPTPLTATLYVMNSANNLYLGITIDDDEFSTVGQFLSKGDGFRIDFDNDHSGTLFALGDEVIGSNAGQPQFNDRFIDGSPVPSSTGKDIDQGGTIDGASVAGRINNKNHFEIEHPLCSGDSLDFCLNSSDVVGFRLEYLDAEANGDFGGSYRFPGELNTSEADIVIGDCDIPDMYTYIPAILK